jgi:hypothetical protein
VNWKPINGDLTIVNTAIGANAFSSSSGVPALGTTTVTGGNGGTGTKTYTIEPPAFTTTELSSNPFEKASLLTFTVGDGVSYETKSVMLRQMNYALLPTAVEYTLNGGTQSKTINIRSNFGWTITNVSDNHGILVNANGLRGITRNANTGGNPLPITLQSEKDSNIGKTATITFTSQIDGSTWDITITATDALYVGMFGGALTRNGDEWQFQRRLYIQRQNQGGTSKTYKWGPENDDTSVRDFSDGKGNTLELYNRANNYLAAEACFTQNSNYTSINAVGHANYVWYLPAQKQLLAVWVSHYSFDDAYKLSSSLALYWSATEVDALNTRTVTFISGSSGYSGKGSLRLVRCVREGN